MKYILSLLAAFIFLACEKQQGNQYIDQDAVKLSDVEKKLNEDAYPMNILSKELKQEVLANIVIDEGIVRGFKNQKLLNSEVDLQVKVDLFEALSGQPVILYGEGDKVLAKSRGVRNKSVVAFVNSLSAVRQPTYTGIVNVSGRSLN